MANSKSKTKKKKVVRRGKNEGSVYQRNDGRWCAVVSLGYDSDGKRVRKIFYGWTRSEVAMKMTAALGEKLNGGHASVINDDLRTLIHDWLVTFKQANVSPRTFETAEMLAKLHVYPHIGELKLAQVTPNIIQGVLNKMLVAGYSLAYVRKVKFLLNQFFAYAKANRFTNDNPVSECIVKSTPEHKERKQETYKAIPIEIREYFLEVISKNDFMKALCMIQMFAGLRIGEALALKWKNVDFQLGRQNRRPPHRNFGHQNGCKRARSAYAQHTENHSARMEEIPLGATAHDRQVVYRSERLGVRQQRRRIAYIHRNENDISTPYASERIGAVQAPLSLLAAHLFEHAVRVARKPESHPNAARSQRRHDDNPHLQQRRPFLLQASRRQTRLEIPLRRQLKALLLNKIPRHKVGDSIYYLSSPQSKHYSPISPNGSPSPHSPPTTSIFNECIIT